MSLSLPNVSHLNNPTDALDVVQTHPGFEFLSEMQNFQEKYGRFYI